LTSEITEKADDCFNLIRWMKRERGTKDDRHKVERKRTKEIDKERRRWEGKRKEKRLGRKYSSLKLYCVLFLDFDL